MKKFCIYLGLQIKRMAKSFPAIFLMTVLLAGGFGLLAWMQVKISQNEPGKQKVSLGVVGDAEDSYLGFGIYALEHLDSSRFTVAFVYLEEEEAQKELERGGISGYIRIPDGFVQSVVSGENLPVTFVGGGSQAGIGTELVHELSDTISEMITETQTGIYSMQEFYLEQDVLESIYEDTDKLNLRYFDVVLSRENIYQIKNVAGDQELSTGGYYLCAAFLVFLLVWGMNCGGLLVKKDPALEKMLSAGGIGSGMQTGGEFLAFLLLMGTNCFGIMAVLTVFAGKFRLPVRELESGRTMLTFALGSWPVLLCTAALLFFLYSLVEGLISGLLLNFLGAVCLGYLSGCFYPLSYFPKTVQKTADFLPTGIGMRYMERYLVQKQYVGELWKLLAYALVFFLLSVYIRKRKLMR